MQRRGATWASSTRTRSVVRLGIATHDLEITKRRALLLLPAAALITATLSQATWVTGWCTGTYFLRADMLQGRLAEAVDAYERALAAAPNFEIVRNNLAIALTELGTRTKLDGEAHANPAPAFACPLCMWNGLIAVVSTVVMRIRYMETLFQLVPLVDARVCHSSIESCRQPEGSIQLCEGRTLIHDIRPLCAVPY